MKLPAKVTKGQAVRADDFNALIDFCQSLVIGPGPGYRRSRSMAGTTLAIDRGRGFWMPVIDGAALKLYNFDLRGALADHFDIEVHVANDANVAAQADSLFGGAEQSSMLIRIADGVGGGLMLDGKPFLGSSFASGELGHVVVVKGGASCACGKRGCLEAEISALLGSQAPNLERIGNLLGAVLAPIVSVLNLREIVLSTPNGIGGPELVNALLSEIRNSTLPETFEGLVVRETKLGGDVVLLGAAAMALSAVLGVA